MTQEQWSWPDVERLQPRWRYVENVEPDYPLMPHAHVVRAVDFKRVADRCAELEAQLQDEATENHRLRARMDEVRKHEKSLRVATIGITAAILPEPDEETR